jgi:hypothetical protein
MLIFFLLNDPTPFCEAALAAIYLLLGISHWRHNRLHGGAYLLAAVVVAIIAAHAALAHARPAPSTPVHPLCASANEIVDRHPAAL